MIQEHGGDIWRYGGCLDFSTNISPLGTPESIKQAYLQCAGNLTWYPEPDSTSLCRAIAGYENVPEDSVICGNGAAELIYSVVQVLHPNTALVAVPSFGEYEKALHSVNACVRRYFLREDRGFILEDAFTEEISGDVQMVFLCSPNNPTGRLAPVDLLEKILARCRETGTLLFLDECFNDFTTDPDAVSMKKYLAEYSNLFILKAFTKKAGIAGLRLGYGLCGNKELMDKVRRHSPCWNVSLPAQAAGMAALKEQDFYQKNREIVFRERPFLTRVLENAGFRVFPSDANFLLFKGGGGLFESMLKQKILIRDCEGFDGLEKGFYRIAVKTHEENLLFEKALRRICLERRG